MTYLFEHRSLREVTEMFPRTAMNLLFQREVEKVIPQVEDPELKSDLVRLYNLDFTGYVDRSLRSAGFSDPDLDGFVHDIMVKFLVTPGGLVSKWKRDAPLSFRFKRALKNAVATLADRASRQRRRVHALPDDVIQDERPRDEEDLITDFRRWLEDQHGIPAVVVFDARLDGRDIKDLIGIAVGIPTAYALKKIVQQIKSAAVRWAGTDPSFQEKVRRLMDADATTVAKRFGRAGVGA